jgi:hypothetical protein
LAHDARKKYGEMASDIGLRQVDQMRVAFA